MRKRMIIMLASVGVVLGLIFGFEWGVAPVLKKKFLASLANPPQTVSTIVAAKEEWQPQLRAIGSLRAVRGTDISPQIAGTVSAIHFESGQDEPEGALLIELASADDVAKLNSLKAQAELARITLERDRRQLAARAVSQQVVDTDEQNYRSAQAQVAQQQAILDYKMIRAPFAGRMGIRQIDVGQYLSPGTAVVTLQSLDPIFVDFTLPQQDISKINVGQKVAVHVDAFPDQVFAGTIAALNSKVDTATRNLQVRATIPNPDHRLLPGMFASVTIDVGTRQNYVTLPQTAVTFNPFGSTVYLVDNKGKGEDGKDQLVARQVFVTTGDTRGDQVAIVKGVNPGDTVVTAGQIKLRNGSPLHIDNTVQPTNNPNPHPVEG